MLIFTIIAIATFPTKMCIKSAPYLHQKCANWLCNMLIFLCFGADFAQAKFVPNSTIRKCSYVINYFKHDAKFTLYTYNVNLYQMAIKREFSAPLQKIVANIVP